MKGSLIGGPEGLQVFFSIFFVLGLGEPPGPQGPLLRTPY